MSSVHRGEIYWLYPEDDNALNKIGLVIENDGNESLFMMCHPDVRLAGHLDAIFQPRDTGLSFAIAAFTHVVLWFPHSRISPAAIAKVSESICDDLELARLGNQTANLTYGLHLGDPVIEPRWPMIEQLVTDFIDDLSAISSSGVRVIDEESFISLLTQAAEAWDPTGLSVEDMYRIQANVMELANLQLENPDWCDDHTFFELTRQILGTSVLVPAA